MGLIYFNDNKQAFAYEIENYIASVDENIWAEYANTDKWDIIDGEFVDISNTPEYISKQEQKAKEARKQDLLSQIDELDKKRIRSVCEPSLKDPESGQTWLEYYNEQVEILRQEIAEL